MEEEQGLEMFKNQADLLNQHLKFSKWNNTCLSNHSLQKLVKSPYEEEEDEMIECALCKQFWNVDTLNPSHSCSQCDYNICKECYQPALESNSDY